MNLCRGIAVRTKHTLKLFSWQVFIKVPQLFVLVPALLGLKGNLEMTLASRLSTQANLGKTESMVDVFRLACGNMALLQCQSVVVGTLASLYAIATSLVASEDVSWRCGILVVSSSIITASFASLLLGGIMISVVVTSKCCRLNPDNVSIPIAAALGDVITLGLLALVSAAIFQSLDALPWISLLVSGPLVLLLPVWTYVAYKNQDTRDVLSSGWLPIISAMLISRLALRWGSSLFQPISYRVLLASFHSSFVTCISHQVLHSTLFGHVMDRDRFMLIMKLLCFTDNEAPVNGYPNPNLRELWFVLTRLTELSVELVEPLIERKTDVYGTYRPDRKGITYLLQSNLNRIGVMPITSVER
ncbi:hypothetical protein HPB47_007993 [Ixodes persulcatus]|uniref:Uncharacterized protein n=1 Tax=Ixodes persulcatus TaxID=34615 RepID=A0AC60P667_IXOPE|nr:hypothetical protein HPB47_007993 [Ixodes persulcatus]